MANGSPSWSRRLLVPWVTFAAGLAVVAVASRSRRGATGSGEKPQ